MEIASYCMLYDTITCRQAYTHIRSFRHHSVTMPVVTGITSLLRIELDQRIDSHDRYASLDRTLQLLNLTHTRLQHACLDAVMYTSLLEI